MGAFSALLLPLLVASMLCWSVGSEQLEAERCRSNAFSPRDVIEKKRDGLELTKEEIEGFIDGFHRGAIPDYQMTAFLMAVTIRGMSVDETSQITAAFTKTGEVLDLKHLSPTVDKHSTGGVGDKVSLALAPLCASLGVYVPMLTGRGLGHTGGTLDKLESLPGVRTNLTTAEFLQQVGSIGVAMTAPTASVAPVDKRIYALRDVTGTTPSLPLLVSSIMSKKLAEGAAALLLDVKTGSGAFLKDEQSAMVLAKLMVQAGNDAGRSTLALMTSNDEPLGYAVGNAVELAEAAQVLSGEGPRDIAELVRVQCALMLLLSGKETGLAAASQACEGNMRNGKGRAKLEEMLVFQGGKEGDLARLVKGESHQAKHRAPVLSEEGGYVVSIESTEIGMCCVALGGGRMMASSEIDHKAGILLRAKVGDHVSPGGELALVLTDLDAQARSRVMDRIRAAFVLSPTRPAKSARGLIGAVVSSGGVVTEWEKFVRGNGLPASAQVKPVT